MICGIWVEPMVIQVVIKNTIAPVVDIKAEMSTCTNFAYFQYAVQRTQIYVFRIVLYTF